MAGKRRKFKREPGRWQYRKFIIIATEGDRTENYHLAVSNPQFEYWLLLHFENGKKISNGKECVRRLRYYCPNYTKNDIQPHKYEKGIDKAIRRAREKDSPPCKSWPRQNGSTVYLLVEELRGS